MHPFVALMRRYCIDYTNSHDQSVCESLMEPDYVVHINGMSLVRSTSYAKSVEQIFRVAPGLGLVVHEFVLNGDRLCMHFSEHGAMPSPAGQALACWRGIGLYKWNGTRLTENYVEQDYVAMQQQLTTGVPHPLGAIHLDPWVTTQPVPADRAAEDVVRAWLDRGHLDDVERHEIDDERTGATYAALLDVDRVVVNDLFSAGPDVPFHVTMHGSYRGGLDVDDRHVGDAASLHVAGIAHVEDGSVRSVRAVTARLRTLGELTGTATFL